MAQAVAEVIAMLGKNWTLIARLIGLGVVAVAGYEIGKAVVGSSKSFESAISMTAYVIPLMAYGMAFNMLMSTFKAMSQMSMTT